MKVDFPQSWTSREHDLLMDIPGEHKLLGKLDFPEYDAVESLSMQSCIGKIYIWSIVVAGSRGTFPNFFLFLFCNNVLIKAKKQICKSGFGIEDYIGGIFVEAELSLCFALIFHKTVLAKIIVIWSIFPCLFFQVLFSTVPNFLKLHSQKPQFRESPSQALCRPKNLEDNQIFLFVSGGKSAHFEFSVLWRPKITY